MVGLVTNIMKNKRVMTSGLLIVTVFLFGAIIYISLLLQGDGDSSVTQIKKTKASSQTYHKTVSFDGESSSASSISSPAPTKALIAKNITNTISSPTPLATTILKPTLMPTINKPTTQPTATLAPTRALFSLSNKTSKSVVSPTATPAPTQSELLTYRNPTPMTSSSSSSKNSLLLFPTSKPVVTSIPFPTPTTHLYSSSSSSSTLTATGVKKLPETGFSQYISLLGIFAMGLIFFAFIL